MRQRTTFLRLALAAAALTAAAAVAWASPDDVADLKQAFRRPAAVPFPPDNPYSPEKAALGRKLFFDPRLSGGGTMACASCHIPALGWEDGRPTGIGEAGEPLSRHTPTLWNLAWGEFFFWDGRAQSLEAQVRTPIENRLEMNLPMTVLVDRLGDFPEYRTAFAASFPDEPEITADVVAKALATYERTLVSPETAFDRWIAGEEDAIGEDAKRGFRLFNGKANCAACHAGWNFTDHAFHDIGLPGDDPGRGAVLNLPEAAHAFKTPTLRDITRRAPYMHDGSLATLAAVIAHYESGIVSRPTLSADLKPIALTPREEADLLAFLKTLSSPGPVDTTPSVVATTAPEAPDGVVRTRIVSQHDKMFDPDHVRIRSGQRLYVHNDDVRTHNLRINDVHLDFNSGAQEPGETVALTFEYPGTYYVFCAIHPKMQLTVEVAE